MPALVNNSVQAFTTNTLTLESAPFAVGGANRVLYAAVMSSTGNPTTDPIAVKWGGASGVDLTKIGSIDLAPYWRMTIWRLIAPAVATDTVYAEWALLPIDEVALVATAVEDADQTTPNQTVVSNSDTSGSSHDITATATGGASGELVLGFAFWGDITATAPTFTSGQTADQIIDGSDLTYEGLGSSNATASGATKAMTWTVNRDPTGGWGEIAMFINPVTSATITGTGDLTIGAITTDGDGIRGSRSAPGPVDVSTPLPTVAGTGIVTGSGSTIFGTGALLLFPLCVVGSGTRTQHITGTGALTIRVPRVHGRSPHSGSGIEGRGVEGTGVSGGSVEGDRV